MNLEELQKNWEVFGATDPLWAIMSEPTKRNGRWELDEFFQTGKRHIAESLALLTKLGVSVPRGKALDFGCGVGRLTQALCDEFQECYGVDISSSMLAGARSYNRHGDRCHYIHNTQNDLKIFADNTFDFILTSVVLQHMEPQFARNYIREFVRVLAPGGVLIFQVPDVLLEQVAPAPAPAPAPEAAPVAVAMPASPRCTVSSEPLSPSATKADLFVLIPPVVIAAGARERVHVEVQNLGDATWPARGGDAPEGWIKLGNHWLDETGAVVINDDARSLLPHDVEPGETVTIALDVQAPTTPGNYILELDLVQEYGTWFATRGSRTTRINVNVTRAEEAFRPQIEMYNIVRAEVVALVESCGGRVFHQIDYPMVEWLSVDYFATK
jgi:SAM-dependent methyltransferase